MAEILSQQQIDALLSEIESGEQGIETAVERRQAKVILYDFRHPNVLSKDQSRLLEMVHARFAKLVEGYLTSTLRKLVNVSLIAIDQVTYADYVLSMSDPSCIYVLHMEKLEGESLMEITLPLVFLLVDRLFGGEGKGTDDVREMTQIEQHVIAKIADDLVGFLNKAWDEVYPIGTSISGFQSRPNFIQIASPEEMVISISLEVSIKSLSGSINLGLPYRLFEEVLATAGKKQDAIARRLKKRSMRERRILSSQVRRATMPVRVTLGQKKITVGDLLALEIGDVICLDTLVDDALTVYIDEVPRFLGRPGMSGTRLAVQIEHGF